MRFNKQQRHNLYKEALNIIKSGEESFMCLALDTAIDDIYDAKTNNFPYIDDPKEFPELHSQKPANVKPDESWFHGIEGRWQRIEVLRNCIEQTK